MSGKVDKEVSHEDAPPARAPHVHTAWLDALTWRFICPECGADLGDAEDAVLG